ncbi:MAG: hypothetical protein AB1349_10885 [Elusimicrobiota bacterium]
MRKNFLGLAVLLMVSYLGWAEEIKTSTTITQNVEYVPKVIIEAKWGTGPGEFGIFKYGGDRIPVVPHAITVKNNIIYILDSANTKVEKYTTTGQHVESIKLKKVKETIINGKKYKLKGTDKLEIIPHLSLNGMGGGLGIDIEVDDSQNIFLLLDGGTVMYDKSGNCNTIYGEFNNVIWSGLRFSKPLKIPRRNYEYLYREKCPNVSKTFRIDHKLTKLIEKKRNSEYSRKSIVTELGEIYELLYDIENLDEDIKVIKWEVKK